MELLLDFGRTVRHYRKTLNVSQEKLAEMSGFHRTYIGQIERGERNPSLVNIKVFADTFGVSITDFFKTCEQLKQ